MSAPRCKPGDLAVVVKSITPGMVGRFVIVERPYIDGEIVDGRLITPDDLRFSWVITSAAEGAKLPTMHVATRNIEYVDRRVFWDEGLRPIRPNEGEDESLSWSRPLSEVES